MPSVNVPGFGVVNFPDDMSEQDINAAIEKDIPAFRQKRDLELRPDLSFGEAAKRAVIRGGKQVSSAFGDIIPAMAASAVGATDYAKKQMEEAAATQEEIANRFAPEVQSYKEVQGPMSALKYGVETFGEQLPNIATALIPGGVGAAVGRRAAMGALGATELGELTAEQAASVAAKQQLGQNVGIYLGSYSQNAPEVFQNIYEQTGQLEPGVSVLFSSVSAALDSAFPAAIMNKLTGPAKMSLVEKILERSGMEPSLLRKVLASAPEGLALEGLTEGAQEAISLKAENFVDKNKGLFNSEGWNRILESSIRGAVAGGAFSTISAVPERMKERAQQQADQTIQDIITQPAPQPQPDVTGVQNGNVRPITEGNRADIQVPGQPPINEVTAGPTDINRPRDVGAPADIGRIETRIKGSPAVETGALEQQTLPGIEPKVVAPKVQNILEEEGIESQQNRFKNELKDIRAEEENNEMTHEPDSPKGILKDMLSTLITRDISQEDLAAIHQYALDNNRLDMAKLAADKAETKANGIETLLENNIEGATPQALEEARSFADNLKATLIAKVQEVQESRQPVSEEVIKDTGETSESIIEHLIKEFGNNIRTAQNRGTLQIVNSAEELANQGVNVAPNAVGAYSKGTSYIIANRLNKDNARSALLHEVGEHHGLEGMLGKDTYKQVLRQVRNMNTMDPAVTAAHDHVNRQYPELKPGTDEHTREVLARIGETAPENTLWRKVVGAVKNFLTKMGLYNPNKMTTADIHDLILHSTRTTLKRGAQKLPGAKVETQEMRSAVPPSGVSRENAKNLINSVGQVYTSLPKYSTNLGKEVRNIVSRSPRWFQQAYISFLSLPQKIELYGNKLPALKNLLVALEHRASMADKERSHIDKLVYAGKAIIDKHPRSIVDKWNKIVLKLSAEEIDPRPFHDVNGKKVPNPNYDANHPLVISFNQLPEDLRNLAIAYTKQYEAYSQQLIEILQKYSPGAGLALKNRWIKHKQPFYHPLRRQGEYWVSFKDKNGEDVVIARRSPAEIKDVIKAAQAQGATDFNQYTKLEKRNYKDAPPGEFVTELMGTLQQDLANKGLSDSDIDGIMNEIYNSYLDLLPTGSIKQQMREREGTPGYIEDVVGGFADIGSKMANQLANLEYRPQIDSAVSDLNGNLENYTGEDKDTLTNVVQDIYNQKSFLDNPVANSVAANLSFISYMWNIAGNVSSAVVNTTQLAMAVFPMLAGRYGYGKAFGAMSAAFKMYYNGGKDNNRVYLPDYTFGINPNISKDHKELYEAAIEASAIRRGPGYELSEMRRHNASDYTGTKAKIETGLSWIFQNTERMNREVTLLAAYDLARANGMSHPAAIKDALDLTMKLHSHALSEAGPRIMQDGIGKVAFTFKRFAQAQIYNTARLFYQAFKDADPATRALARRQLVGIYSMTYVFSGAQGLPVYGAANMLTSAIAGMFGDDEPFDFDEEVREAIGDLGYKGPMNKLLGVDIASRTGFNGMIFRTDEQRLAEVGLGPYFVEHFFGPAYQVLAINPGRAAKLWQEGHTERAIETVVPVFVKNPMKAFRFATEGATTKDGVKVIDQVGPISSFLQIWGFTNTELAEAYARANSMKQAEKQILDRKTSLVNLHYLAKINCDDDMLEKVNEDIAKFNASFPRSITLETLRRSEAQHEVRLKKSVDGVYLSKKYAKKIEEDYGS
jgi:hypothetical protein